MDIPLPNRADGVSGRRDHPLPRVYCRRMGTLLRAGAFVVLSAAALASLARDVVADVGDAAQHTAGDLAQPRQPAALKTAIAYAEVRPLWDLLQPHLPPA